MIDALNNWVLSVFASNEIFSNQIESSRRRFQTLNLIYINLILLTLAVFCMGVFKFIDDSPGLNLLILELFPPLVVNLVLIRKKKLEAATMLVACTLIISNKIVAELLQQPLTSIAGLFLYPSILLISSSSVKVMVFSAVLCVARSYYCSIQIYDMYKVAITDEQTSQIVIFLANSAIISFSISLMAIQQKFLETKVWALAQENYNRSEQLNKEMILAMEAKDRFISMVSHEIRNPLNTLKGSVEYLIQVENNPKHLKVLKSAQLSGEILLNLVNNVLDAAKLKSDKMEIHRSSTSFVDVVKKVFTVNSELLKDKKLIAKAHIDENLPANIFVDSSRLLQILLNLMSNAVKFTPKGGKIEIYAEWCNAQEKKQNLSKQIIDLNRDLLRPPKATERRYEPEVFSTIEEMGSDELLEFSRKLENMSTEYERKYVFHPNGQDESDPWELRIGRVSSGRRHERRDESEHMGYLKVQVIDTGCGISANEIPKLFGMFEQATEHTRSVHGGSGLGLWICKQICQRMNGDITLYSEVNKGSSFVFYIPVETRPRDQLGSMVSISNERLKALVVDDFPTNRYLHKLLLEQQGVRVTLASDGKEALEKYKGQKPGEDEFKFILMDVNMPGMDGFAAAKKIREYEIEIGRRLTDIYFVTGEYFNEEDVLTRFKNVGGTRSGIKYLNKPLDTEALRKLILNYK